MCSALTKSKSWSTPNESRKKIGKFNFSIWKTFSTFHVIAALCVQAETKHIKKKSREGKKKKRKKIFVVFWIWSDTMNFFFFYHIFTSICYFRTQSMTLNLLFFVLVGRNFFYLVQHTFLPISNSNKYNFSCSLQSLFFVAFCRKSCEDCLKKKYVFRWSHERIFTMNKTEWEETKFSHPRKFLVWTKNFFLSIHFLSDL